MQIKEGIVVTDVKTKKNILKENVSSFCDYTFYSLTEFKKKFYPTVKKTGIIKVMNKYNVSFEYAMSLCQSIMYIDKDSYNDPKLDSLVSIKNYLNSENELEEDNLFFNLLKRCHVTFINPIENKEFNLLIQKVKNYTTYEIFKQNNTQYDLSVTEFDTADNEIRYVCNTISSLLDSNVDASKIHIVNYQDDYKFLFARMQKSYNIRFNIPVSSNTLSKNSVSIFLNALRTKDTFKEVFDSLGDIDDQSIKYALDICNDYNLQNESPSKYIDFYIAQFKRENFDVIKYDNAIDISSSLGELYEDDEYIFFIGFNQNYTYKVYKDEDFISSSQRIILGLDSIDELNYYSKINFVNKLKSIKNLYISSRNKSQTQKYDKSSLVSELKIKENKAPTLNGVSKIEDSLRLASCLGSYIKYQDCLDELKKTYYPEFKYDSFDNKFSGLDREIYAKYKPEIVSLSYTSLKGFMACPFSYYLGRILKLDTFEETLQTKIGVFVHALLEDSYKNIDFDESVNNHLHEAFGPKEEFYFRKYIPLVKELISFNKSAEEKSILKDTYTEKNITLSYFDGKLEFTGFIDKLRYGYQNGEYYLYIVDYKTGSDVISLKNVSDGMNMQLPIYMYLLKEDNKYKKEVVFDKNVNICGIYLQKVNVQNFKHDDKKTTEMQRLNSFKLQGYSSKDFNKLSMVDPEFMNSTYISGMKLKKDSSFYSYAKVLSVKEEEYLIDTIKKNVFSTYEYINNGEFKIEPIKYNDKNQSCMFCKYKDICFVKYEDFKEVEERDLESEVEENEIN